MNEQKRFQMPIACVSNLLVQELMIRVSFSFINCVHPAGHYIKEKERQASIEDEHDEREAFGHNSFLLEPQFSLVKEMNSYAQRR